MGARDLALRALVTKHLADTVTAATKTLRSDLGAEMANGDRVGITSPDNPELDLGMVYRTKPKGTAGITDTALFTGWMITHYPDRVQETYTITERDMGAAIKVLQEHAPDLVTATPVVMPWAASEVLALTEKARQACGPGGELGIPGVAYQPPASGTVTVRLSDDGPAAIERLWRAGRIDLGTGEVRELESAPHVGGPVGDTP